jgi:hypothetical protein
MKLIKFLIAAAIAMSFSFSAQAAEDSSFSSSSTAKVPVPTGKYITGGILASTAGFGIGHAIQGRYNDKGWIFTATEATGAAMFLIGAGSCSEKTDIYGTKKTECSNAGIGVVGLGVWIGFHVWEIVDAWAGATPVEDGPKAFFIPNPEAPGLGLAWSF